MRKKAIKNRVFRVLRGGSLFNVTRSLRATNRKWSEPENRFRGGGFRLTARKK
jgi:formylglycine-generating enzyme required for sulfatase activity